MSFRLVFALLWLVLGGVATQSFADEKAKAEFRHEAHVLARLGNHPNVVQFIGAFTADVSFSETRDGENPLYQGQTHQVTNAIYNGAAPPGDPDGVEAFTFDLVTFGEPRLHAEGIVHRDIATRNMLVTTNGGTYSAGPDAFVLFGHDGGAKVQGGGVGPIRWMAPESLRLFNTDPAAGADDYLDILPGSYFDVTYVPEPAGAAALAALLAFARRRRGTA